MLKRSFLAALLALAGCSKGHGGQDAGAADLAVAGAFAAHDKVDILFMIDSSGTAPIRTELQRRFAGLFAALQAAGGAHPASYHIGVVDEDLGAGPYVLNGGQCHPDGDGGKLHGSPAHPPAGVNCSSFMLAGGVQFIDYDQIHGTDNTGATGLTTALICMSGVGDAGCGFEHQLESVYRALHDPPPENAGFLRDDALLVVIFLTDEDDCSAPSDSDLFDPSPDGVAKYGTLHSFRCTQWGITCGSSPMPLSSTVALAPRDDCRPLTQAEGGKLFDVQRYIDFFVRPGGVKADPSDVILASIAAPPTPVGSTISSPCADQVNTPQCAILNHSCVAPSNSMYFGDPAVRISAVVDSALTSQRNSICEVDFSPAVDGLAQKIIARLR